MNGGELKHRWRQNRFSPGCACLSSDPNVALVAARNGFDWVLIDQEHLPRNPETVAALIQAVRRTPACPLVRVDRNDCDLVGQYLDLGAEGVMVPLIRTADDARRAVASCRYPPRGVRSFGPGGACEFASPKDYFARANDDIVAMLQLEVIEFIQHADEILAVEGIDAIYIGTMDLSLSMHLFERFDHPDFVAAVAAGVKAARSRGIPVGVPVQGLGGLDRCLTWLKEHSLDVQLLGIGSDLWLVERGAQTVLPTILTAPGSQKG